MDTLTDASVDASMDASSDEYKPYYGNRFGPLSAVWRSVKSLARRTTGFFMLSDDENVKAGIDLSGEGRGK
jgi:hypothetical protein